MLRIQYEVFFFDPVLNIAEPTSVFVDVLPDVTPQQFRAVFTQAILDTAAQMWPSMELNPSDCLIDVMQRGN